MAAGGVEQVGEVAQAQGDVRVAGRQRSALQIQGLAIQGLSLGVAASGVEQVGEVAQAQGDVRVAGRQRRALQIQGLLV